MGGRIAIDKRMLALALAAVPFLLFVGYVAAQQGATVIGGMLIIGTLICFIGVLPGLSPALDVVWDKAGVSGPTQVWGPFIGLKRASLAWDEITRIGGTGVGYVYLQGRDGRRIYWTEQHRDHHRFFAAIQRRRPDLFME
jgi:hypothetical protein